MAVWYFIIIIVGYFLGCFNTGYYYARFFYRQDIRTIGTNVTGALNVSRLAGKKGFIITFLGDAAKGAVLVILCHWLRMDETITLLGIFMVLLGHIFPVQLKFRGGKGLSTAFGAFIAFQPIIIVYLLITCAVLLPFVKRYTVTSLIALLILPVEMYFLCYSWKTICFFLLYALLINYACRDNLKEFLKKRHRSKQ